MSNLTLSIIDGIFYSLMLGFGETYLVPYAVKLGASDFQLGLLSSLPLLAGSLAQVASPRFVQGFGGRRPLVRLCVMLQALSFLPLLSLSTLPRGGAILLIAIVVLYWIFQLGGAAAWQSWMGDLVPETIRGDYFSRRSRWIQLATFSSVVTGGLLLQRFGFVVIFLLAFVSRLGSFFVLKRQEEPPHHTPPEFQFTFFEFIRKMRFNNYGLFVLYSAVFAVAHYLAGPYFNPYLLRTLQVSPSQFMLAQAVFVASKSLFLPVWGHYSDRYGSRKLLSLAGYLCPILPLLWILARDLLGVVLVQVAAGFVWAGMELCAFNFILDCTTPARRTRCAAYYQVFVGLGSVAGALLGSLVLQLPLFFEISYYKVFLVSGVARLLVSLYFLPRIRELRTVEPISYRTLLVRMFFFLKPTSN